MSNISMQTLYQLQIHITEELSQRAQATEIEFEVLTLEQAKIQKAHMELKQKNEEMGKFSKLYILWCRGYIRKS